MKNRDWVWLIGTLLFVVWVDQGSKYLVGRFELPQYSNSGVMGGLMEGFPPLLKTVVVSELGLLLLFGFAIAQLLLPGRLMTMRFGLSIFSGGVLGNLIDRISNGEVLDFLLLPIGNQNRLAINFGDIAQWVAVVIVFYALIKNFDQIFPKENLRKNRWVNTRYQIRYLFTQLTIVGGATLISLVLSYTFLRFSLHTHPGFTRTNSRMFTVFLGVYTSFHLIYMGAVWYLSEIFSSRTAGAIFAFERYIRGRVAGRDPWPNGFRLRSQDDFKELEVLAQDLESVIQSSHR